MLGLPRGQDMRDYLRRVDPVVWEFVIKLGISAALTLTITYYMMGIIDPSIKTRAAAKKSRKEILRRLNRPDIKTSEQEDAIAKDAVNPDDIDVTFEDIGGLQDVKQRLHELVILPFTRPDLFSRGKLLRPPRGVLLYGPPGTGKTMLAKAIAKQTKAVFLTLSMSSIQDKWFGESQKLVRAVWELAWKIQPTIIFIDEIDAFLRERKDNEHETTANMKSEFMALWDGLSTDPTAQVVVIGATNRPWAIDKAILRRMPRAFCIDIPGPEQREAILQSILKEENCLNIDYTLLANSTERYSGSDLKELCRAALLAPVQELMAKERAGEHQLSSDSLRPLSTQDILQARDQVSPTGEYANEYFERSGGMSLDDFARYLAGGGV